MRSALILTLAFLPLADVMDGMAFVRTTMPTGVSSVLRPATESNHFVFDGFLHCTAGNVEHLRHHPSGHRSPKQLVRILEQCLR